MVIRVKKKPLNQLRSVQCIRLCLVQLVPSLVLSTIVGQYNWSKYNWCSVQLVPSTIGPSTIGARYNWCPVQLTWHPVQLVPSTIYSFPVFNARTRPPGIPNHPLQISQKTEIFWFCFVSCSDMIFLLPYLSIFPLKLLMAWLIKFSPAELSWRCPGKTWSSQCSVESPSVVNPTRQYM